MICLLIAAFSALFAFATRSSCLKRKMRRVEKIANGGFLLAFSGLFAKVAMADGAATADEVETVEKMFSDMGFSRAERALCVGNFLLMQREKNDALEDARALAASMNHAACTLLYGLLVRVANADGRISREEEILLKGVGEALGLNVEEQARLHAGDLSGLDGKALADAGVPVVLARLAGSGR